MGGRPVLDWLMDRILALKRVERVHLVTNHKFSSHFRRWAALSGIADRITIHDDGSTCEEDRLGAVGDMNLVIQEIGRREDLLVAAGDNIFDFDLTPLCDLSKSTGAPAIGVRRAPTKEEVRRFGVVELDQDMRIVGFQEKPDEPRSLDFSLCLYLLPASTLDLIGEYLSRGGNPDAPGMYISWLVQRTSCYGHRFESGDWFDIGDMASLKEADARFSAREGRA